MKSYRHILTALFVLSMLCSSVPAVHAFAEDTAPSELAGTSAEETSSLKYKVYTSYVAVTGCDRTLEELVIPAEIEGLPVTVIESNAFYSYSSLKKVVLPDTIREIRNCAFQYATNLTEINLPESLEKIGINAFNSCYALTSVTIPDRVSEMGSSAFSGCNALEEITLPQELPAYPDNLLYGCVNLKRIVCRNPEFVFPENAVYSDNSLTIAGFSGSTAETYAEQFSLNFESLGEFVREEIPEYQPNPELILHEDGTGAYGFLEFKTVQEEIHITRCDMSVTEIEVPAEISGLPVTAIEKYAFQSCKKLEKVILPETLKEIGTNAFSMCYALEEIHLPESLEKIDFNVFAVCRSLKSITIPSKVKALVSTSFIGCENLESVQVSEENPYLCSVDGVVFDKKVRTLMIYPPAKPDTEYTVPDTVTGINGFSFDNAINLKKITMHDNVMWLLTGDTFANCSSLEEIELSGKLPGMPSDVFFNCKSLKRITIHSNVKNIGASAFKGCESLESVCIPVNVQSVDTSAFSGCSALKEVSILNPDCEIADDASVFADFTGVIYGYENSTAQAYAEKYGYSFQNIENYTSEHLADANLDGSVTVSDAVFLQKYLTGKADMTNMQYLSSDVNQDGKVNIFDLILLKRHLLKII